MSSNESTTKNTIIPIGGEGHEQAKDDTVPVDDGTVEDEVIVHDPQSPADPPADPPTDPPPMKR